MDAVSTPDPKRVPDGTSVGRRNRWRSRRTVAVVVVAIAALLAGGIGWGIAHVVGGGSTTVTFTTSTASIRNPERGWFDSSYLLTNRDYSQAKADGVTLVRGTVELDADRNGPLPQSVLDQLQAGLDAVRAAGLKTIVRVAYNQGPYPNSKPDASLSVILTQIKQLGPIFTKNADVISSFEAGYIGAWGEWHTSTNGLDTNAQAKETIYKAIMAAYPASRSVAFRYPSDIRTLTESADAATVARTGNHQDCFLASVPDDEGTWGRDGTHSVAQDKALIAKIGTSGVVGGETCGMSARVTCPIATSELASMHFSYLNRQYEPTVLAKLKKDGCLSTIGNRLGYRFVLKSATVATTASPGGTASLAFTVTNTGYAHLVNSRPVYAVLSKGSTRVAIKLNADASTWAAGATTTVSSDLAIPSSLAKGTYQVALWLPDASSTLRNRVDYDVQFANVGTWNASTGTNVLTGATITVG